VGMTDASPPWFAWARCEGRKPVHCCVSPPCTVFTPPGLEGQLAAVGMQPVHRCVPPLHCAHIAWAQRSGEAARTLLSLSPLHCVHTAWGSGAQLASVARTLLCLSPLHCAHTAWGSGAQLAAVGDGGARGGGGGRARRGGAAPLGQHPQAGGGPGDPHGRRHRAAPPENVKDLFKSLLIL
jgi:hypothetical protein